MPACQISEETISYLTVSPSTPDADNNHEILPTPDGGHYSHSSLPSLPSSSPSAASSSSSVSSSSWRRNFDLARNLNLSSSYEFYDEMNDLDAVYKEIHSDHNQFDFLLSSLEAILRVIFYLFFFALCLLLIVNVASDKVILLQTYHAVLNAISSFPSPHYFLHSASASTCSSFLAARGCDDSHSHILLH